MSTKPLEIAVVGSDLAGLSRIDAAVRSPVCDLVAVVPDAALPSGSATRYGAKLTHSDLQPRSPKSHSIEHLIVSDIDNAADNSEVVVLSSPQAASPECVKHLLGRGQHVITDFLPTTSLEDLTDLYRQAIESERSLHISCVSLFEGVPTNLRARLQPVSIESAVLKCQTIVSPPESESELLWNHLAALHHLVDSAGTIQAIDSVNFAEMTLSAELRTTDGASVDLALSHGPFAKGFLELTIKDHFAVWRQYNNALFIGRSPQTSLQGMRVYRDDFGRFTRHVRQGSTLKPDPETWRHVLKILLRLGSGETGPVD